MLFASNTWLNIKKNTIKDVYMLKFQYWTKKASNLFVNNLLPSKENNYLISSKHFINQAI